MRRADRVGLWWVPLLLFMAPLLGWMPAHRDLIGFFAPMRDLTAELVGAGVGPWINLANGCGEAWFANPETAVLYPPAWLHLVLPGSWALTAEIALHLALLSLGVGLVARELGASREGRTLAEVAAWSAGPVLVTVGVLNNLETLTWLPWMALAARLEDRRSLPLLAVATALGWLGGEPQVWAMGVVLVIVVARRRAQALIGISLGVAVIAVQLVPFLAWVAEGDRGPAASWLLRGAVTPVDWSGVLVPGLLSTAGRMVYAESLFLGAPLLVCALLGGWRRRWLLGVVVVFAVLATLPEIGAGRLFVILTGGLVRYPSRFALIGLVLLLPLAGRGADDWLAGRGRWLAAAASGLTLVACVASSHPLRWWVAGAPALLMLIAALAPARRPLRAAALIAGVAGTVVAGLPLIGLRPVSDVRAAQPTWPEAVGGGRVYVPTPAEDVMPWLASGLGARRLWPVGYLNIEEGLTMTRTDAPVANRRLASHIAITDEGPAKRWWLDALAAEWIILPDGEGLPEGMEQVASRGGMRLLRNHGALPVMWISNGPPDPDRPGSRIGVVTEKTLAGNACSMMVTTPTEAWLSISLAPVNGWRWRLDGRPVLLDQGPGIIQYIRVPAGSHQLEGRYRPPMHLLTTIVSGCAVLVILAGLARRRREP
ncbi:hypothetical protein ACFLQM_01015 [Acidobacteriota bacterium]